jgi:hypothetical protein
MKVRADLDGAVSGVGNFEFDFAAAFVGDHVAFREQIFAWYHVILSTQKHYDVIPRSPRRPRNDT